MNSRFAMIDITHNRVNDIYSIYAFDKLLEVLIVADILSTLPTVDTIKRELDNYANGSYSQFYVLGKFASEYALYSDMIHTKFADTISQQ